MSGRRAREAKAWKAAARAYAADGAWFIPALSRNQSKKWRQRQRRAWRNLRPNGKPWRVRKPTLADLQRLRDRIFEGQQ